MSKVKVQITYSWEFDQNQWTDTKQHWERVQEELTDKIEFDATNMFFCLRNISKPDVENYSVEQAQ
jgi:hypothetical protein